MRGIIFASIALLGTVTSLLSHHAFARFSDTDGHAYEQAIVYVQSEGIVEGYDDETFRPDAAINRAEFVKIIVGAALPGASGSDCFPDVRTQWFAPFICTAQQRGMVGGYPDGTFRPEQEVNFAEAAKIIVRVFELPTAPGVLWYQPFVDALREQGAVPPSIVRVDQQLSRGEMAAIIFALAQSKQSGDRELDDFDVSASEQRVWEERIDAAFATSDCPELPAQTFPTGYYKGPLIDTHLHIPAIDDSEPQTGWFAREEEEEEPEGRFGGPQAILGENVTMSAIACTLRREGTTKNFAFFPVYDGMPKQAVQIVRRTMQMYPDLFTAFLMPPGPDDRIPTLDADFVENVLSYYPGLFRGYGEIGLYSIEGVREDVPPDATLFQGIYPLVKQNKLLVYFHPGEGHRKNFERIFAQEPDITFIVHGEEIEGAIGDLMEKYPNVYFTADDILVSYLFPLYVGKSKQAFVTALERDFESILAKAVKKWKPIIEAHPDRFLWGTDRGDAVWNYDVDVGQLLIRYARAFIGKLDPKVQEKFAWKNAEEVLRRGSATQNHAVRIGYVGCSNTTQTVEGYHRMGGTNLWPYDKRYDGGAVLDWARNAASGNKYWDIFDERLTEHPNTDTIWWQLCIRDDDRETSAAHVQDILVAIRKRLPDARIYVSALADYTDGICGITGTFGLEKAKELVQMLTTQEENVLPGPVLGPMTAQDTDDDGCHLSSPDGKKKLGQQMRKFFDPK